MSLPHPITDGVVTIRPSRPDDVPVLVAGRDEQSRRFLGDGTPEPDPTAVVEVDGAVVGWVDFDIDRTWLAPGEVNVGYQLFAEARGNGYGTRAVQLLAHHLAQHTDHRVMTLFVNRDNHPSQALARRVGCAEPVDFDGHPYFVRPVPPRRYTDGVVTLRRLEADDIDADLAAKDDEQIDWLWLPGEREQWESMSADEQRSHALRGLIARRDRFGAGPKWCFAVDGPGADYVANVDVDLANEHVRPGEANISYSCHPAFRGRGFVSRGVRLVLTFLADNTGARVAHIRVDADNVASRRVAAAVGAVEAERSVEGGRTMIRHVVAVPRRAAGGAGRSGGADR